MPISPIVLQRRHAELGRIRLGAKGDRGQPTRLAQFRFTSPSERYIRDLAALYGGEARPWDNNGKPEFEVYTEATSIPVIVVKGGLSQWLETWSGGGCVHRCDGERDTEGNACDPNDKAHQAARPTTRLSVMLPELEAVGVFRMESHGWNAAAEIPAVAELAQFVGDLVPANLHLVERRTIRDGRTSRFVVPVLDLQIGAAGLRQLVAEKSSAGLELGAGPTAAGAVGAAAIEAAPVARRDYAAEAAQASTLDEVREIWRQAVQAGHMNPALETALRERVADLQPAQPAQPATSADDAEVDGEPSWVAGDTGRDEALWTSVIAAGGRLGMTTSQVEEAYSEWTQGELLADANDRRLAEFLEYLKSQAVPA